MIACSIVIPVFNGMPWIRSAVESALSQSFEGLEVLVVDNASTDGTYEWLNSVNAPNLRVIRNKENIGMTPNWNECLRLSVGRWVKFLCADDTLEPGAIASFVEAAEKSGARLIVCPRVKFDGTKEEIHGRRFSGLVDGMLVARESLAEDSNFWGEPTAVMFRRDQGIEAGAFDSKWRMVPDWDLWLRLSALGKVLFLESALVRVRVHPGQETNRMMKTAIAHREDYMLLRQYAERWFPGDQVVARSVEAAKLRWLVRWAKSDPGRFLAGGVSEITPGVIAAALRSVKRKFAALFPAH